MLNDLLLQQGHDKRSMAKASVVPLAVSLRSKCSDPKGRCGRCGGQAADLASLQAESQRERRGSLKRAHAPEGELTDCRLTLHRNHRVPQP